MKWRGVWLYQIERKRPYQNLLYKKIPINRLIVGISFPLFFVARTGFEPDK